MTKLTHRPIRLYNNKWWRFSPSLMSQNWCHKAEMNLTFSRRAILTSLMSPASMTPSRPSPPVSSMHAAMIDLCWSQVETTHKRVVELQTDILHYREEHPWMKLWSRCDFDSCGIWTNTQTMSMAKWQAASCDSLYCHDCTLPQRCQWFASHQRAAAAHGTRLDCMPKQQHIWLAQSWSRLEILHLPH